MLSQESHLLNTGIALNHIVLLKYVSMLLFKDVFFLLFLSHLRFFMLVSVKPCDG